MIDLLTHCHHAMKPQGKVLLVERDPDRKNTRVAGSGVGCVYARGGGRQRAH